MKAILTKYLGPTDTRGSRVRASDMDGNAVTISYDDALSSELAHRKAAVALCDKMGWDTRLVSGGIKHGYAFVFVP